MRRDCETACREEVCRSAECRGAAAADGADPNRQTAGTPGAEGAHPAEGRCVGRRRGMERQRNRRSTRYQHRHRCPHPPTIGGRRSGRRADPQAFSRSARKRVFDGVAEAKLIALACSEPPKGRSRWTLQLLETAVVELNIVARASDNTIGRTLKKTRLSPIFRSSGSSRPKPTPPS